MLLPVARLVRGVAEALTKSNLLLLVLQFCLSGQHDFLQILPCRMRVGLRRHRHQVFAIRSLLLAVELRVQAVSGHRGVQVIHLVAMILVDQQ